MKVRDIAYSRSGGKGDINNICVFVHDPKDWDTLRERLTTEIVTDKFGGLVNGPIERYEVASLHGINFVMHEALDGGVAMSIIPDGDGKCRQSLMQDIEL